MEDIDKKILFNTIGKIFLLIFIVGTVAVITTLLENIPVGTTNLGVIFILLTIVIGGGIAAYIFTGWKYIIDEKNKVIKWNSNGITKQWIKFSEIKEIRYADVYLPKSLIKVPGLEINNLKIPFELLDDKIEFIEKLERITGKQIIEPPRNN